MAARAPCAVQHIPPSTCCFSPCSHVWAVVCVGMHLIATVICDNSPIQLQNCMQRSISVDGGEAIVCLCIWNTIARKDDMLLWCVIFMCVRVHFFFCLFSTGENISTYFGVQPSFLRHQGGARTPHPGPPQVLHHINVFISKIKQHQNLIFKTEFNKFLYMDLSVCFLFIVMITEK